MTAVMAGDVENLHIDREGDESVHTLCVIYSFAAMGHHEVRLPLP